MQKVERFTNSRFTLVYRCPFRQFETQNPTTHPLWRAQPLQVKNWVSQGPDCDISAKKPTPLLDRVCVRGDDNELAFSFFLTATMYLV